MRVFYRLDIFFLELALSYPSEYLYFIVSVAIKEVGSNLLFKGNTFSLILCAYIYYDLLYEVTRLMPRLPFWLQSYFLHRSLIRSIYYWFYQIHVETLFAEILSLIAIDLWRRNWNCVIYVLYDYWLSCLSAY